MRRFVKPIALSVLAGSAFIVPAMAYPPGESVGVVLNARVYLPKEAFSTRIVNIKPASKCLIIYNKKKYDCTTAENILHFEQDLSAPSQRGRHRIVVSVPADGEFGLSNQTTIFVPQIRASASAKVGRDYTPQVKYLPEDSQVDLTVDNVVVSSVFADADGLATDLLWTPDTPTATGVKKTLRIYADGKLIWTKAMKVSKAARSS